MYLGRDLQPLWDLARDPRVPDQLRLGHAFTLDYAIVRQPHFRDMAVACRLVGDSLYATDGVNHWPAWADLFNELAEDGCPMGAIGVGLGCSSALDPWESYPIGDPNHEPLDCVAYARDIRHG